MGKTEDEKKLTQSVQNCFTRNLRWENSLDYVVYRKERLDKLLSVGTNIINNFICITDTGFNLIHCSQKIPPPNPTYEHLAETGHYGRDEIETITQCVLSRSDSRLVILQEPTPHNPCAALHYPLFIDEAYVFHIAMPLDPLQSEAAQSVRFAKFVQRAAALCSDFWKNKIELDSPCHKMLINLISGKKVPRSHVDTQLHITGIPSNARYRLLNFRLDSTKNQSINRAITAAAKTINRGNSHAFMRDSNLLVLCYTPPSNETAASLNKVMRNIADTMHKPYGIAAGISQVFTDIKDIDFAYKQTVEALNRRHSLMKMYPEGYFDDAAFPGFPFDHVLQFIVFDEHRDQELVRYSLAHSNLHTLAKEDAEAGTDTVSLLWSYIRDGRNASRTSEKMHVHRNTVIYHVKKFEGRFDLSLNSTMVRHRLLFDFIEYFRVQS